MQDIIDKDSVVNAYPSAAVSVNEKGQEMSDLENLCKKVIASDVNQNALNSAIKNISLRKLDIETVLSDGINDVNLKGINTLIISGKDSYIYNCHNGEFIEKINTNDFNLYTN